MNCIKKPINRRDFLISGGLSLTLPAFLHATPTVEKKNVLFIGIDDLKPLLGCYNNPTLKTPNIDSIASRGTVFLNNHCQQAVCGPSRASLMTGLWPDQTGVWDLKTQMRNVNPDVLTIPQYFKQNGYETVATGKIYDTRCVAKDYDSQSWTIPYTHPSQLTYNEKHGRPIFASYQGSVKKEAEELLAKAESEGITGWGPQMEYIKKHNPNLTPIWESADVPDDAYTDGAICNSAISYIEKFVSMRKPFFLAVGFQKPHLPFVAPKKYFDLYPLDSINIAEFQDRAAGSPDVAYRVNAELRQYGGLSSIVSLPEKEQKELIRAYYACVSYIDALVGVLLEKLKQFQLFENTVICLWGDHGFHLGDHNLWGKHTNFEQSTRSPLIFADGSIKGGGKTNTPTDFIDIFPTLCELTSLTIPSHLLGKSLVPVMRDPNVNVKKAASSQFPRGELMGYTIRTKKYRYTAWIKKEKWVAPSNGKIIATELYDYDKDPLEKSSKIEDPAYATIKAELEKVFAEIVLARPTLGTGSLGSKQNTVTQTKNESTTSVNSGQQLWKASIKDKVTCKNGTATAGPNAMKFHLTGSGWGGGTIVLNVPFTSFENGDQLILRGSAIATAGSLSKVKIGLKSGAAKIDLPIAEVLLKDGKQFEAVFSITELLDAADGETALGNITVGSIEGGKDITVEFTTLEVK